MKVKLIREIIILIKAVNIKVDGDLFFGLAFRTIKELKLIKLDLVANGL